MNLIFIISFVFSSGIIYGFIASALREYYVESDNGRNPFKSFEFLNVTICSTFSLVCMTISYVLTAYLLDGTLCHIIANLIVFFGELFACSYLVCYLRDRTGLFLSYALEVYGIELEP